MKKTLLKLLQLVIAILLIILTSCKQKEEPQPQAFVSVDTEELTAEERSTIHTDTAYKYEYRTGSSGDYTYNYDVSGYDANGNEVTGNVTMEDKYGKGTLTAFEGEEMEVEVEWIGYGELKATDGEGNEYELTVD